MNQPTPNVTRADVEHVIRRDFPTIKSSDILAILDEYGTENFHREVSRVQLAILKLADGSKCKLLEELETAKSDYRDILSAAEYPNYSWDGDAISAQQMIKSDWAQYCDWLNK